MAPEKDQHSEWTASNEVDWDKIMTTMTQSWRELTPEQQKAKMAERAAQSKQAWIDPRARREMAREKAKDSVVTESKPPELTAEEKSKKLTELHAEMHEHVKRLVAERNPEQGPKEPK
ncbi:hypothetical protein K4K61_007547 [Colletotrichum sp. SAR11_59]|nr:hypothetical protein K4K61_007547 [Colletotrichum sp. SAR11_59]